MAREWLSIQEYNTFLSAVDDSLMYSLLTKLCYNGGFRISEILNAKRRDFIKENEVYCYLKMDNTKRRVGKPTVQPIDPKMYAEIQLYCNEKGIANDQYVFQSLSGGKLSYITCLKRIQRYTEKARIDKNITTHSFRRSRATHLLKEGRDLAFVSGFLRHKNVVVTMEYLNIEKEWMAEELYGEKKPSYY